MRNGIEWILEKMKLSDGEEMEGVETEAEVEVAGENVFVVSHTEVKKERAEE